MTYELIPGIKQDHRGRLYQIARYPSGKSVEVPYKDEAVEWAQTLPIPEEPRRAQRSARTSLMLSNRKALTEHRFKGKQEIHRLVWDNAIAAQAFIDAGRAHQAKDGTLISDSPWDYHQQMHDILLEAM